MASGGVLGLGAGGASSLNQETIDKLKKAESKARIEPIEKKIEGWDKEFEKVSEVESMVNQLISSLSNLTLSSKHSNVFESVSASTSGSGSVVFNANDVSGLNPGNIDVHVTQLAKNEISNSKAFGDKDTKITDTGTASSFTINLGAVDGAGGTDYTFNTENKSFQELADEINSSEHFVASIEQIAESGDKYKLVIKSANTGESNAMMFTSSGLETDHVLYAADTTEDSSDASSNFTQLQEGQNFKGTIDNMDYDRASNTITLQGNLTMTAVAKDETDKSTLLTLERDSSLIMPAVNEFVDSYNKLQSFINAEMIDEESPIYDKSMLRTMLSGIKDKIFGEFGDDNKTLFDHGFEVDYSGNLSVNSATFATELKDNFSGLKEFFLGDKGTDGIIGTDDDVTGFGTDLFKLLDTYDDYKTGLITSYGENMGTRKTSWEEELAKAQKTIDDRYALMASQFAQYGAVINQMESAFGGMKMMIEQSTAKG